MFAVRTPTAISPTTDETSMAEGTDRQRRVLEVESYLELIHPAGVDVREPSDGLSERAQRCRGVAVGAVPPEYVCPIEDVEYFSAQRQGFASGYVDPDLAEK